MNVKLKDWVGNTTSVFSTMGASNHVKEERQQRDYYATHPSAVEWLVKLETFNSPILEPACGEGHISEVLLEHGYNVVSSDIYNYGYGKVKNFYDYTHWNGDIITNPPYKYALEFCEHALKIIQDGNKVAMFLKLQFLEGQKRRKFFEKHPPVRVWVSSKRLKCAKNGDFNSIQSSAVAYCWFIWKKGFKGDPIIKWFN